MTSDTARTRTTPPIVPGGAGESLPVTYGLLLNLVGVASTDDKDLIWGFVKRYAAEASPESHPELDALIDHALAYFRDFVKDSLERRAPDEQEAAALRRPRVLEAGAELAGQQLGEAVLEALAARVREGQVVGIGADTQCRRRRGRGTARDEDDQEPGERGVHGSAKTQRVPPRGVCRGRSRIALTKPPPAD